MYLKRYKSGFSLINILFVLMIITLMSTYSCKIVLNNKRAGITISYIDLYKLRELEEILPVVNLYLKEKGINENIKDGICRNISSDIAIIYSNRLDKIQINYKYDGVSKGRFFRYKYIEENLILLPEEGKYE